MGSEGNGEQGAGAAGRGSAGGDASNRDSTSRDSTSRDSTSRGGTNRDSANRKSSDPIGDFQRWLMKAGARSIGREVADRVRSTISGGRPSSGDVWDVATTEPPPDEAPECAWCPICRAARRYRDSGGTSGGLGSQIAGVSDTLAGLAQDAFSIFEQALRTQQRPPSRPASTTNGGMTTVSQPPAGPGPANADTPAPEPEAPAESPGVPEPSDDGPVVGSPVLGGTAVHPQDQDGEATDEGGDREERGEAGDGPASSLGDDQVEGTAD